MPARNNRLPFLVAMENGAGGLGIPGANTIFLIMFCLRRALRLIAAMQLYETRDQTTAVASISSR
jgi:hypothetical protein